MSDPIWQVTFRIPELSLGAIAKQSVLWCHLTNTNEQLGGLVTAIPPFAILLWSLLYYCYDYWKTKAQNRKHRLRL